MEQDTSSFVPRPLSANFAPKGLKGRCDGKAKEGDLNKAIKKYVELHVNKGLVYIVRNNTIMATVLRSNGSTGFIRNGRKVRPTSFCAHAAGLSASNAKSATTGNPTIRRSHSRR